MKHTKFTHQTFEDFMEQYERLVFRNLLKLTKSRETAADLKQESFFKLLDTGAWVNHPNQKALVLRTATNLFIDQCRREKCRRAILSIEQSKRIEFEVNENLEDLSDISLEENLNAKDGGEFLDKLSLNMTEDQKQVLQLTRLGYSNTEIARMLKQTYSWVYVRWQQIIRKGKDMILSFSSSELAFDWMNLI